MSNDTQDLEKGAAVFGRLFKLWAMIAKMVLDGKRDPQKVADHLQLVVDDAKSFASDQIQVLDWLKFYREVFNLDLEPQLDNLKLPDKRNSFGWLVLVAQGLTPNVVFEKCHKRFKDEVWRYYEDLDQAIKENDREPTETYVIRVRDRVEADEEHKDKSANTTAQAGVKGMTSLERMLLELWYHWKTGDHLDKEIMTICAGSRYANGRVPGAAWGGDKFNVGSVRPGGADDDWRVREVVS